ncbi:MAG TPA: hypothetical protein V6C65_01275, partial [Allocoleopsis sp.]
EPRFLSSALESYWKEARYPVWAMTSDELRQAIENPALKQALYFEELKDSKGNLIGNLVSKLVDEVGQMPGALPLLSFTLSELYVSLYKRWQTDPKNTDRTLRFADYKALGGVAGALTRRATEEYQALNEEQQATMRRVMLRMVAIEGEGIARRRVPMSELQYASNEENKRVKAIVERLINARLAVKGQEAAASYVEPAHDFLVRGWDQLQSWIKQNQTDLALQQRLTPATNDWAKNDRNTEYLWIRDPRLALLEKVLESNINNWMNQLELEFVEASKRKRFDELEETKRQLEISEERRLAAELELASVMTLRRFETEKGIVALIQAMKTCQALLDWAKDKDLKLENYPTVSPIFTLQTILDSLYEQQYFFYGSEHDKFWAWMDEHQSSFAESNAERIIPAFETGHSDSELIYSLDEQYFISIEKSEIPIANAKWRIWKSPQEAITKVLD